MLATRLSAFSVLARKLAPGAMLARLLPPQPPVPLRFEHAIAPLGASHSPVHPAGNSTLFDWLEGIVLMAVPKKRLSYTRKRVRQAGQIRARGPHLQSNQYMCPVCERMRLPHRVCDREDCRTYWKHRWF